MFYKQKKSSSDGVLGGALTLDLFSRTKLSNQNIAQRVPCTVGNTTDTKHEIHVALSLSYLFDKKGLRVAVSTTLSDTAICTERYVSLQSKETL